MRGLASLRHIQRRNRVGRPRRSSLFHTGEIPVIDTRSLVLEATWFVIHFTRGRGTVCPRSQPQSCQETETGEASLEMEASASVTPRGCHSDLSYRLPCRIFSFPFLFHLLHKTQTFFFC